MIAQLPVRQRFRLHRQPQMRKFRPGLWPLNLLLEFLPGAQFLNLLLSRP
jgi:hypothetical protein